MWNGKTVSVILPTYNEKDSIRASIGEFAATGVVDEIVVINNNAAPGTSEEVAQTAAIEIHEPRQGYGAAIQRGLREAKGDYLILAEPDGTFAGADIFKLLAYADDFDVVFGTRTTSSLIGEGANMGLFLKWGNWAVAKLMEFLFDTTHLSDVGCTMRLIKREALRRIQDGFTVQGSHFGPEMMLLVIQRGLSYIEVPVHYRARVGESSVTGSHWKAFLLGLRMIALILDHRFAADPAGRWVFGSRLAAQVALYGLAALWLGSGLGAALLLGIGRTAAPPVLDIPSVWLQLTALVLTLIIGAGVVGVLRIAAHWIVALAPATVEPGRHVAARWAQAGLSVGLSVAVVAPWLGAIADEWRAPVASLAALLLAAVVALDVAGTRAAALAVAIVGTWLVVRPAGLDPVLTAVGLVGVWPALRWVRDRGWPEVIAAAVGLTVAAVVSPVAALGGLAVLAVLITGRPMLRWGAALPRPVAPVASSALVPVGALPAPLSAAAVDGAVGPAGHILTIWLASGPFGAIVGFVGALGLLYSWKERPSGLLALAAVVTFAAGLLPNQPAATTAAIHTPIALIGAAVLLDATVRRMRGASRPPVAA